MSLPFNNAVQQLGDPHPHLCTDRHHLVRVNLKQVEYLLPDPVHVRPGEVDLVEDGEDLEIVGEGEVEV